MRTRLKIHNPAIRMENWTPVSRKVKESLQILTFSIDKESCRVLEVSLTTPFYKLSMVTFRVLKDLEDRINSDTGEPTTK